MASKDKRAKKRPKYTTRAKYPASYPCGCVHRSAHKRIDELYGCRCGLLWRVSITWTRQDATGMTHSPQEGSGTSDVPSGVKGGALREDFTAS